MRLNKYVANATGHSRRAADELIAGGRIMVNNRPGVLGQQVSESDLIELDGQKLSPAKFIYLMLNKPPGYVSSRRGQNAPTIYELLPEQYRSLKSVGRLDKDSSGLLLLSNDGDFTNRMTHPTFGKTKVYEVQLNNPLDAGQRTRLENGVGLEDGPSRLQILQEVGEHLVLAMSEGRNRQIRRSFAALGLNVVGLHRTRFGPYSLNKLQSGKYQEVQKYE